jgi:curved DNA-binding protein CbpA
LDATGEIAQGVLPAVLRALYVERRTGLLHVTRGAERSSICFIGGNIAYGDTNIKECHLGETLVRHGLLTQWDRERAAEMVTVTGRRLGQILLDLGLLDADGLEDALALQVREVLLTIFSWTEGEYAFEAQEPEAFRGYDKPLRLSTAEVILDAVWSVPDPDIIRFQLGDLDRVLALTSDPLLRYQSVTLTPVDGFVVSRVDGELTAREILSLAPVSQEEAERSLFGLLYIGMVLYLPASTKGKQPTAASLRRHIIETHASFAMHDHYEVLGVSQDAPEAEILAAYFRLTKAYHPDGHRQAGLSDLKLTLEAISGRLAEALKVLSDPVARARYDQRSHAVGPVAPAAAPAPAEANVDPKQIEEMLDRAAEALATGRQHQAFMLVGEALPGAKGRLRRRARVLRAEARLKSGEGRRAAEAELKAAIDEDPGNPEAHFLLGTIYKSGGANALAAASFRKALRLKPRYHEAHAELLALEPDAGSEGDGVLRRLLGK